MKINLNKNFNENDYFFSIDEELNDEKEFVVIYKEKNSGWLIYPETKAGVSQSKAGEIRNSLSRKSNIVDSKIINKDGCFAKVDKMNSALYSSLNEEIKTSELSKFEFESIKPLLDKVVKSVAVNYKNFLEFVSTKDTIDDFDKDSDECWSDIVEEDIENFSDIEDYDIIRDSAKIHGIANKNAYGGGVLEFWKNCENYMYDKLHEIAKVEFPNAVNIYDEDLNKESIKLTRRQIGKLNSICYKYSGWKLPEEIRPLWDELEEAGVNPIIIMGYPTDVAEDGGKSWEVPYKFEGKDVINSTFIYQVYEGNGDSLKNEYNIYFS